VPVKGKWGLGGATNVRLKAVDATTARSALAMAWRNAGEARRQHKRFANPVSAH